MKIFESYWRVNEHRLIAYRLNLDAGSAELVKITYGHRKGVGLLNRYNIHTRPHPQPKHKKFGFNGRDAASHLIGKYLEQIDGLKRIAKPVFQYDLVSMRIKSYAELLLDKASLHLGAGDIDQAEQIIQTLSSSHDRDSPASMYFQTIAMLTADAQMRVEDNKVHMREYRDTAERWAVAITENYRRLMRNEEFPQQYIGYYFDTAYKTAGSQLAAAVIVRARNAMQFDLNPEMALHLIEFAASTGQVSAELYRLFVKILITLNRKEEAYALYDKWQTVIGNMEELDSDPAFLSFQHAINQLKVVMAARSRALISVVSERATAWSEEQVLRLESMFTHLPPALRKWLRSDSGSVLIKNSLTGQQEHYERYTLDQSLDRHVEFMEWLHMYDEMWPDEAIRIHSNLRNAGFNPQRLVPIMPGKQAPDCFLIRLSGKKSDTGAIYYWDHQRRDQLTLVAAGVEELLSGVEDWSHNLVT